MFGKATSESVPLPSSSCLLRWLDGDRRSLGTVRLSCSPIFIPYRKRKCLQAATNASCTVGNVLGDANVRRSRSQHGMRPNVVPAARSDPQLRCDARLICSVTFSNQNQQSLRCARWTGGTSQWNNSSSTGTIVLQHFSPRKSHFSASFSTKPIARRYVKSRDAFNSSAEPLRSRRIKYMLRVASIMRVHWNVRVCIASSSERAGCCGQHNVRCRAGPLLRDPHRF